MKDYIGTGRVWAWKVYRNLELSSHSLPDLTCNSSKDGGKGASNRCRDLGVRMLAARAHPGRWKPIASDLGNRQPGAAGRKAVIKGKEKGGTHLDSGRKGAGSCAHKTI